MAEVNLKINGRSYPIMCDDGQEKRIELLSTYIDKHVRDIASSGAASNENHLLILTSLILADEIFDLRDNLDAANDVLSSVTEGGDSVNLAENTAVLETLRSLASRISIVSDSLKKI